MFVTKNETEHFSYEDCVIREFEVSEDGIALTVEALIVEPKNSQNTNFTRSYADLSKILMEGGKIRKAVREGCKRYDADDKLLEEIPDEDLTKEELDKLLATISGQYLYDLKEAKASENAKSLVLGIEMTTEDLTGVDAESYQILVECRDVIITWERYLNRVQQ